MPEEELVLLEALREAEAGGQSDSALAAALHDVGELYRVQGNLATAEPYFWRALPVWAASVGAMDPRMAMSLSSLALVFETKKEYTKAVPLVETGAQQSERRHLALIIPRSFPVLNNMPACFGL